VKPKDLLKRNEKPGADIFGFVEPVAFCGSDAFF